MGFGYTNRALARKVLDTTFADEPTQDLIGGGTFTIGGNSWVTDNHGFASTYDVLNGTGLRPWTGATSTGWGTPTGASALSLKLAGIVGKFGRSGHQTLGVYVRVSLDASSADAATEACGFSLIDTSNANSAVGLDMGHDGTNIVVAARRDGAAVVKVTTDATINGALATIGAEYKAGGINLFWGDGVTQGQSFDDMTQNLNTAAVIVANTGALGADYDLYLYAQTGNTSANYQPAIKRAELWLVEARRP